MAIAGIAVTDTGEAVRVKLNATITEANKVQQIRDDLVGAIATLRIEDDAYFRAATAGYQAADVPLREGIDDLGETAFGQEVGRPGDAHQAWSAIGTGLPLSRAPLDPLLVATDSEGRVARVVGQQIVAPRAAFRVEPGRAYLLRFVYRRRVNPVDPAGDAVTCAVSWLDRFCAPLGGTPLSVIVSSTLTVAMGRRIVSTVVAMAAGGDVDTVAPAGTVYCTPYVQTFGLDGTTDIEAIEWTDVTDAAAYSPDLANAEARIGALESLDIDDRLISLEGSVTGNGTQAFSTRADAVAASVAISVDYLSIGGLVYARIASDPGHAHALQTLDGAWWTLSTPTLDCRAPMPTLTAGVASPAADVVGATTVHVTRNPGDTVGLYDGELFRAYGFNDGSLALLAGTYITNTNFDVYAFLLNGAVKFGTRAWTSATSRGTGAGTTEIEAFQGRLVNKFAITLHENGNNHNVAARRALLCGSFRTKAAGQSEDSKSFRLVDGVTDPPRKRLSRVASTANWPYSAASWALADNGNGNLVIGYLHCLAGRPVSAEVMDGAVNSTATVRVVRCDIGLGSAVPNAQTSTPAILAGFNAGFCHARYRGHPGIGYRELWWLEMGAGGDTQTWLGTGGASTAGITAEI